MHSLLIKMSSMGDVFHTFPALTDLQRCRPDVRIDWVVEENFADIAAWHPAVNRVIPISLRRWVKHRGKSDLRQFKDWRNEFQTERYDLVLDAQGLLKSAVIAKLANTDNRHGYNGESARESIASWFYQVKHAIPQQQHAVERTRQLFAAAFDYEQPDAMRFGIQEHFAHVRKEPNQLVFIMGTSWSTKLWSPEGWEELTRTAVREGYQVEMIWGSDDERELADNVIQQVPEATRSIERLTIPQVAEKLVAATAVVGLDTGFAHLAGALETPTVALYGPTSPDKVGLIGDHTRNLQLSPALDCMPCHKRECRLLPEGSTDTPPCLSGIQASTVWRRLQETLA